MCNPTFCVSGPIHTAVALRTANSVQMEVDESIMLLLMADFHAPFPGALCVQNNETGSTVEVRSDQEHGNGGTESLLIL